MRCLDCSLGLPVSDARVDQWVADLNDQEPRRIKDLVPAVEIGHEPLHRLSHEEISYLSDFATAGRGDFNSRSGSRELCV